MATVGKFSDRCFSCYCSNQFPDTGIFGFNFPDAAVSHSNSRSLETISTSNSSRMADYIFMVNTRAPGYVLSLETMVALACGSIPQPSSDQAAS